MNTRLKSLHLVLLLAIFGVGYAAAQDKQKQKTNKSKEKQQIIITQDADKNEKMTIVVDGDKITINGKPVAEYKDGEITIHKGDLEEFNWDEEHFRNPDLFVETHPRIHVAPYRYKFDYHNNDGEVHVMTISGPMLGLTSKDNSKGAEVTDVVDGSAAEKAGLKVGDIITKVGDKKVTDPESLSDAVKSYKPNQEVNVTYIRAGKAKTVSVKLGERKQSNTFNYKGQGPDEFKSFTIPEMKGWGDHGEWFNEWNLEGRPRLGLRIQDTENGDGVNVLEVKEGSPAEKAGVKKDDKIVEIDGKAVKNADDVNDYLRDNREKSTFPLKLMRAGAAMNLEVKIPKKLKTSDL